MQECHALIFVDNSLLKCVCHACSSCPYDNCGGCRLCLLTHHFTCEVHTICKAMSGCCVFLHAGASKTTFSNNTANCKRYGGDVFVDGAANVRATGATFSNALSQSGGSIYAYSNVTLESCNTTAARATDFGGGCIFADTKSNVRLLSVVLSACRCVVRTVAELFCQIQWMLHTTFGPHILSGCTQSVSCLHRALHSALSQCLA